MKRKLLVMVALASLVACSNNTEVEEKDENGLYELPEMSEENVYYNCSRTICTKEFFVQNIQSIDEMEPIFRENYQFMRDYATEALLSMYGIEYDKDKEFWNRTYGR